MCALYKHIFHCILLQAMQPIRAAALLYAAADMVRAAAAIALARWLTSCQHHAPSQALLSICHMEGRGLPVEHNVACVDTRAAHAQLTRSTRAAHAQKLRVPRHVVSQVSIRATQR